LIWIVETLSGRDGWTKRADGGGLVVVVLLVHSLAVALRWVGHYTTMGTCWYIDTLGFYVSGHGGLESELARFYYRVVIDDNYSTLLAESSQPLVV
jgi:hypothetical protein